MILLEATLIAATPLLLAALGGLCSERGGVVNIALEGIILAGAFAAAAVTLATGSAFLGLLGGAAAGAALGALHALVSIVLRADQVVSGVAMNLLADAGTVLLLATVYGSRGSTPQLGEEDLATVLGLPALSIAALAAVPAVAWILYRTRWGLRLRACGESPEAADAAGIAVHRYRFSGVVASGLLAGLAGVHLALTAGSFTKHMAAGRGYIALAALVFGRWRPVPVAIGCLVFALGQGLQDCLEIWAPVSPRVAGMLPYLLTLVVLALRPLLGRRRGLGPPAALGRPFVKA
jgi:simple sugar transport system permease protein